MPGFCSACGRATAGEGAPSTGTASSTTSICVARGRKTLWCGSSGGVITTVCASQRWPAPPITESYPPARMTETLPSAWWCRPSRKEGANQALVTIMPPASMLRVRVELKGCSMRAVLARTAPLSFRSGRPGEHFRPRGRGSSGPSCRYATTPSFGCARGLRRRPPRRWIVHGGWWLRGPRVPRARLLAGRLGGPRREGRPRGIQPHRRRSIRMLRPGVLDRRRWTPRREPLLLRPIRTPVEAGLDHGGWGLEGEGTGRGAFGIGPVPGRVAAPWRRHRIGSHDSDAAGWAPRPSGDRSVAGRRRAVAILVGGPLLASLRDRGLREPGVRPARFL